jgi:predicted acylesterase/phospholipase RssA
VLGTGINPGFLLDALVLTLSGATQRVQSVRAERIVDVSQRRLQLQRKVGVGLSRREFEERLATGRFGHVGSKESARLLAAAGIRLKPGQRVAVDMLAGWLEDEGRDAGPNIVEAILGAFTIAQRSIKAERMRQDPPEHTVTPDVGSIGFLDFHRGAEALAAGEAAAAGLLQALRPANT